jgi:S-DNA-T family DNA segregation ATPase FtsK/SpoIIIE
MSRPNRRRLRRHANKIRNDGFQPMMFVNSGDELPETATAAAIRALWRYRSELAPIAVALLTVIAANLLHRSHPGAWSWLAAATVAGIITFTIPMPNAPSNLWPLLDHPAERVYATVITLSIGGWLTAATAIGPKTTPMPALAVVLTGFVSIPWWTSRRRRAKVSLDRQLESWPEIARAVGLAGSQIMSALVDVWGWRARLRLARGQTINDVIAKTPALESGLGTFRGAVRVYPTPDDLANRCELRVLNIDPHADAIPWPGPSTTTITEPIDLGPFEDASPCHVLFLRRHVLLGGATGAGKSGGLNVLLGNLAACKDVVIWGIDLKKGMELRPWAPCIDRLATTADEAPAAIKHADSIARRGRAVAVNLIAATQRPTQKAMGHGAVRSQMDVRISFRVRERKDVDLILGQGMLNAGWQADKLNAPGKFLIAATEHDSPKHARAYLLTDAIVADTAEVYAAERPALDEASQEAIEKNHEIRSAGCPEVPPQLPCAPETETTEFGAADSEETTPDTVLWAALSLAPDGGTTVPDLMEATGMSRPWIYQRLRILAERQQVVQVSRGRWRAVTGYTP